MESAKRLMTALQLLESIPCVGKENMTRMLMAMQTISEVATDLIEREKEFKFQEIERGE